jgi:hypothetical protein
MAIALFGQLTAIIADNCPNNVLEAAFGSGVDRKCSAWNGPVS